MKRIYGVWRRNAASSRSGRRWSPAAGKDHHYHHHAHQHIELAPSMASALHQSRLCFDTPHILRHWGKPKWEPTTHKIIPLLKPRGSQSPLHGKLYVYRSHRNIQFASGWAHQQSPTCGQEIPARSNSILINTRHGATFFLRRNTRASSSVLFISFPHSILPLLSWVVSSFFSSYTIHLAI